MSIDEILAAANMLLNQVYSRFLELLQAPINNSEILWSAIPLLIGTLFIILYFGRYKNEELGWNTAFGNTMVFLFVALNLVKKMYSENGGGSFENIFNNEFYFTLTIGLILAGLFFMFVTYFHVLPKRFAFFMFSAPPINVSAYVIMTIVYAKVPADGITLLATLVFLSIILAIGKLLQFLEGAIGLELKSQAEEPESIRELPDMETTKKLKTQQKGMNAGFSRTWNGKES